MTSRVLVSHLRELPTSLLRSKNAAKEASKGLDTADMLWRVPAIHLDLRRLDGSRSPMTWQS
jgi:hypothetical protein